MESRQAKSTASIGPNPRELLPKAFAGPAQKTGMGRAPAAQGGRQIAPRRAGFEHPQNGMKKTAIVGAGPAARVPQRPKGALHAQPARVVQGAARAFKISHCSLQRKGK